MADRLKKIGTAVLTSQQFGMVCVILLISILLTSFGGSHQVGNQASVNNFLNSNTILLVLTDSSLFAIMAIGITAVIISGGIDLSVGAIYALCGVTVGLVFKSNLFIEAGWAPVGLILSCVVGVLAGAINGLMVCFLGVHPFIITLGTMLIFRGIAFITTQAMSINLPNSFHEVVTVSLGLPEGLAPIPALTMILVTMGGWLFLTKSVAGRRVYALGGNPIATRYSGVKINPVLMTVYCLSGLTAGIAAFVGGAYYGAVSSGDGTSYELFVIASAVVGGVSLLGGKGSAISAMLGAILIALMKHSVRILKFDQNYEQIIIGCAIIVAVVLDRMSSKMSLAKSTQQR